MHSFEVTLKITGKNVIYIDVVTLYMTVMFYNNYPVVHPVKSKNTDKLFFTLCIEEKNKVCEHINEQLVFIGSWTT